MDLQPAGLAGAIVLGVKILDKLVSMLERRFGREEKHEHVLKLDPEVSRMLVATHAAAQKSAGKIERMEEIVSRSDEDGGMLIYFPRRVESKIEKIDQHLQGLALDLKAKE